MMQWRPLPLPARELRAGEPMTENQSLAARLREAADLLQAQRANPFRVAAYRRAAGTLEQLEEPVRHIFDAAGREGLDALPGVGRGIASSIAEMLVTGQWAQLQRLRGDAEPEKLLQAVPGIGPELARQLHDMLHIETLEALELACIGGQLAAVPGIGARRAAGICASLSALLDRRRGSPRTRRQQRPAHEPAVALVLDVDREYRRRAAVGDLPTIAPRRLNPTGASWLPVMHTRRAAWFFTVMYSNTARAHELGRTRDWVVVFFYDQEHVESQCTVVTETHGALAGKRVVRGREDECKAYYSERHPGMSSDALLRAVKATTADDSSGRNRR
jgi:hypothetical protein